MWKRITGFFAHALIQLLGLSGVVAVITWVTTELAGLQIWQIWLATIFSIGCVVWLSNQIAIWRERTKKKISKLSDKEIEATIHEWVDTPFYKFQREPNPSCLFQFIVTDPQDRPVTIMRLKERPSQILLASAVVLSNEHQARFAARSDIEKQDIIRGLRIEMARFGISFEGIGLPLDRVSLSEAIPLDDSLSGFYFDRRILFVRRAVSLIQELIAQKLIQPNAIDKSVETA